MNARSSAIVAGIAIAGVGAYARLRKRRSDPKDTFTMTVFAPLEEVRNRWESDERTRADEATFTPAPGERGTEVTIRSGHKMREHLRAFKQVLETGTLTIAVARP